MKNALTPAVRLAFAMWLALSAGRVARAEDRVFPPLAEAPAGTTIKLPYAFYNEMFGATGAFVYSRNGFPQRQSQLLATAMVGTAGSAMVYARATNLQLPGSARLFVDPVLSIGRYHDNTLYVSDNPLYPSERGGSNESSNDNYIKGNGWDNYVRLPFRYLLPIGWGRDHTETDYRLEGGLLTSGATGGDSLNPLTSGKTTLGLKPFYRSLSVNSSTLDRSQKTNGVAADLTWDNRDFPTNPSLGQSIKLSCSRDPGWFGSTNSWSFVEAELDQYFSLGSSERFRQRVIALDVWTGSSPTWEYRSDGTVRNRPPTFEGAYLGGVWRMRGYPFARFSDKAAIYYGAEYRMTPRWNPFTRWTRLQEKIGVEWIQIVPFAELGRVAPTWNVATLHSSMKWDAGIGIRALAKGLLVRIDVAASSAGLGVQMMVDHPFRF